MVFFVTKCNLLSKFHIVLIHTRIVISRNFGKSRFDTVDIFDAERVNYNVQVCQQAC